MYVLVVVGLGSRLLLCAGLVGIDVWGMKRPKRKRTKNKNFFLA